MPSCRRRGRAWFWIVLGALAFALLVQSEAAYAATITVTTTADPLSVNGNCSLREAIQAANTDGATDACTAGSGADTIVLPAGTYTLTIPGAHEDANLTGDLDITASLTISGAGAGTTIIEGGGSISAFVDRVFHLRAPVTISGVTIRNGRDIEGGAGIRVDGGALTLNSSTVSGNGGGCCSEGGGIYMFGGAVTLNNSTVSGNVAGRGGGIFNARSLFGVTLNNSTVSGNQAVDGGAGIYNGEIGAMINLNNSTISGNTTTFAAGGIHNVAPFVTVTAKNTIVANNSGDCSSVFFPDSPGIISAGHNLSSDSSCGFTAPGDQQNTNPLLGPLADNGGPTQTQALLTGSPAIDAGSSDCPPPATDQRGVARPQGAACDIGAFELVVADASIAATGSTFSATERASFSATVATFTDPDTAATASEYSATIAWGDTTNSAGTVSGPTGGPFTVSGSHTYAVEGTYTVTVTIIDIDTPSNTAIASSTANVADSPTDVGIDIIPFLFPNTIKLSAGLPIPVAILSRPGFAAPTQVDQASLTFGRTGSERSLLVCLPFGVDVNRDSLRDLVCAFLLRPSGFRLGDTAGILRGRTVAGASFVGRDSVRIVP